MNLRLISAALFLTMVFFNHSNAKESKNNSCPELENLMSDPGFINRIVKRFDLKNQMRFYSQENTVMFKQAYQYAQEQGLCHAPKNRCRVSEDLINDPVFIEKIARQNGLSSMRFFSLETEEQKKMILSYVRKNNLCD